MEGIKLVKKITEFCIQISDNFISLCVPLIYSIKLIYAIIQTVISIVLYLLFLNIQDIYFTKC